MKNNSSLYKNIFFEYKFSKNTQYRGAIVLLDGLPSNPMSKEALIQELAAEGYDVFFPRYEGTWESKGKFLEQSPCDAIIELITALKEGINLERKVYKASNIYVLGASFGGGVALNISNEKNVNKTCAISPVISFKKVIGINTLEAYLKSAHDKSYRFDSNNWQNLLNDEFWNLDKVIGTNNNVLIIAGENDDQILESDITDFGKSNNIPVSVYPTGHITLSKISKTMLDEILRFFST